MYRAGQPGQDDYRFVVSQSRGKLALLVLGAAAFVAVGVWMCSTALNAQPGSSSRPPELVLAFGALSILFFGACLLWGVTRLVAPKPAVVLDSTGLYDHASAAAVGFIPWSDIELVMEISMGWQRMLSIQVREPEAVVARTSGLKKLALRANLKMMTTPIHIPQTLLPVPVSELEREINRTLWGEHASSL
ncbi:STM3941 family protein [Allosaccharopolyspora coralli]|uniref:STM3941 family protein n=1 Tax=Allosaccharopolyspora coralli TaxID=2665642 RepID=UPI002B40237D|nr:STM3941 family protein [Allosaccharopolyspora coralli]